MVKHDYVSEEQKISCQSCFVYGSACNTLDGIRLEYRQSVLCHDRNVQRLRVS